MQRGTGISHWRERFARARARARPHLRVIVFYPSDDYRGLYPDLPYPRARVQLG